MASIAAASRNPQLKAAHLAPPMMASKARLPIGRPMSKKALLTGEKLDLTPTLNDQIKVSEEAIVKKYVSGEIRIVTEQGRTQLPELPSILQSERYLLQPDYQRRHRWTQGKQSRLIESFLMNVPIPPIFLYEFEYARYEVMDGVQRLTSLDKFYRDELALTELEYWRELEGMTYSTLPAQLRQGIDRRYLSSIVLLYETARDEEQAQRLKQLVFERINSGGVRLSYQESRNAISRGPLNDKLARLARTTSFCRTWKIPEPDEEELATGTVRDEVLGDSRYQSMEDVEIVLRFFAHRQRTSVGPLRNMKPFLDTYWTKANAAFSSDLVDELGDLFVSTIDMAYAILGESAFFLRRDRGNERVWVPRPTLIAYDAVMGAFSRYVEDADKLLERKETIAKRLQAIYDSSPADFDGRRTDSQDVQRRDELISDMLDEVLAAS
jgi:hypothetical protein